ncbi:hypothetical protein ONZ43_g4633 [Nemania bipapillata]|uniref:Uncharacterized protein n=1 Tax=Nemania bipapillata TaxID=110536 RepID=A0ACC2IK99_9PEZI|nr:hypothetical protein ONZ43_g4633 [Nemania bipapillata]
MAPLSNLFILLALGSIEVLANPTAALLQDVLSVVSLDVAPLVTEVLTTTKTYPATAPTTYTSSTYDTDCQCHYSTIYWWTPTYPAYPYPTSSSTPTKPPTTVTVTKTTTVATTTTTTVTATATVTAPCTPALTCDKYGYLIQNVTLFQVDLSSGKYTQVADHLGDDTSINAIAYNTLDNFVSAFGREYGLDGYGGGKEEYWEMCLKATAPENLIGNFDYLQGLLEEKDGDGDEEVRG